MDRLVTTRTRSSCGSILFRMIVATHLHGSLPIEQDITLHGWLTYADHYDVVSTAYSGYLHHPTNPNPDPKDIDPEVEITTMTSLETASVV